MYKLIQFIDISDGNAGMLIPVFSSNSTNLPYVQQMDEYFQTTEMLPFLEYENYDLLLAEEARSIQIDDAGLIAFRAPDASIVAGSATEIIEYLELHRDLVQQSPHLLSQLQRIEAAPLTAAYETWRQVASISFSDSKQQEFWTKSELSLFQSQRKIWDEIGTTQTEQSGKKVGLAQPASRFSAEYLIRWLSDRDHFVYSDWVKIWHYVNEGNPFDQRLLDVAQQWLFFGQAEGNDLGEARTILFTLFHHAKFSGTDLSRLGPFLAEELSSTPYSIYNFLRPSELFSHLLWFLGSFGEPDDVIEIINFCVDEVPRASYISNALLEALAAITDRPDTDEAVRREANILARSIHDEASGKET